MRRGEQWSKKKDNKRERAPNSVQCPQLDGNSDCMVDLEVWEFLGTSLVVQWLRFHSSTAGDAGLIPGQRTEIPHAPWHGPPKSMSIS